MRICRPLLLSLLSLAALAAGPASASDAVAQRSASRGGGGPDSYGSAKEALRSGLRNYNDGDKAAAVRALEYAADQGHALASWKLGRMYAQGDGVARDDLKAFEYFSRIADENADEAPDSPRASVVAGAFVALGTYLLDGINNSTVSANPEKAAELYLYAGSYFGDPNAQYSLAQLYLKGRGVDRDERQAARWFNLAAEKGHAGAQALLGTMLLNGQGVPRERARGLMWLMLAKEAADPKREAWIWSMHAEALEAATETDRRTATAFLERFQTKRR
jgi:TPR repeat protein